MLPSCSSSIPTTEIVTSPVSATALPSCSHILESIYGSLTAVNKRQHKRKAEKAEVLTSSPYEQKLQDKEKMGKKPTNKTKLQKKQEKHKTLKRGKKNVTEEWPCIVCGELYANSRAGKQWVQYVGSLMWVT